MYLTLILWIALAHWACVESVADFGTVPGYRTSDNNSEVELLWEVTGQDIIETVSTDRTFSVNGSPILSRNFGNTISKDGIEYVGNLSFTGIRIGAVSKEFAGSYTCHISFPSVPSITDISTFLYVFDKPSLPPNETDSVQQLENTSYSFNCTSESTSYPVENRTQHTLIYRWTFEPPMNIDRYDTSSSDPGQHQDDILTVNQLMRGDDYVITCTVGEDDSSLTSSVYYTLKTWYVPGSVTTDDPMVEVETGASFDLLVEATDPGYPQSMFFCNMSYKNELLNSTDGQFMFHPVDKEHSETIECYLENDVGRGLGLIITVIVTAVLHLWEIFLIVLAVLLIFAIIIVAIILCWRFKWLCFNPDCRRTKVYCGSDSVEKGTNGLDRLKPDTTPSGRSTADTGKVDVSGPGADDKLSQLTTEDLTNGRPLPSPRKRRRKKKSKEREPED